MPAMSDYYVIQVYTGTEKKAVEAIKKNVPREIVQDCFFVVKRRKKKYQGTWHLVEENCFPGYVFLESDNPKKIAGSLASLRIYARLLGLNKETFYVQPIDKQERFFIDSITNRTPDGNELNVGIVYARQLLELLPNARVVAIGQKSACTLQKFGVPCSCVPHPSMGGANKFKAAIAELFSC